jgi:hypothetical protein
MERPAREIKEETGQPRLSTLVEVEVVRQAQVLTAQAILLLVLQVLVETACQSVSRVPDLTWLVVVVEPVTPTQA